MSPLREHAPAGIPRHPRRSARGLFAAGAVAVLALGGLSACSGGSKTGARIGGLSNLSSTPGKPQLDTSLLGSDAGGLSSDSGAALSSDSTSGALSSGGSTSFDGQYFSFEVPAGYTKTTEDGYMAAYENATASAELMVSSPNLLKGITDVTQAAKKLEASFSAKGYTAVKQALESNLTFDTDSDQDFILSNPTTDGGLAASVVIHGGQPVLLLALFDNYSDHAAITADLAHIADSWTWNF